MAIILPAAVARWIDDNGYRSTGYAREVYLEALDDPCTRWVTELQEPIVLADSSGKWETP